MHRNKNRSTKYEQNSEVFCRNSNNLVFLCKTRSLTIGIHIKSHRAAFSKDIAQQPSFTHGMTNTFCIGDFDLSFLIQGVQGGFSITTSTTPRPSTA